MTLVEVQFGFHWIEHVPYSTFELFKFKYCNKKIHYIHYLLLQYLIHSTSHSDDVGLFAIKMAHDCQVAVSFVIDGF